MYRKRLRLVILDGIAPVVGATSLGAMIIVAFHGFTDSQASAGPLVARAWFFATVYVGGGRILLALTQRRARARDITGKPTLIVGAGVATRQWHGLMGWAEAGSSIGYLDHHARPDYRGGASWARFYGRNIYSSERGLFLENNADSVFIGRFNNDLINYGQLHAGYTPATPRIATQLVWNAGLTFDARRQYWANFIETGPGVRVHVNGTPRPLVFSANFLRGAYLINRGNPRGPNFNDLRIGLWYAFTH
jgi:hypothetical protein